MKGSKQKRSAFLKRSYFRQCLIVVLAFLMVLQFSVPTVRGAVFAGSEDTSVEQLQNEALNADQDKTVEDGETDQVDPPETSDDAQKTTKNDGVAADEPGNDSETADQAVKETKEGSDEEQGEAKENSEAPKDTSKEQKEEKEDSEETQIVLDKDSDDTDAESEESKENKENLEEKSDETEEGSDADISSKKGLKAVVLQGEAATDEEAAALALVNEAGASAKEAYKIAKDMFRPVKGDGDGGDIGIIEDGDNVAGDGSWIEYMHARWITEDTDHDHGDTEDILYVRPPGDNEQTVRLQLDYGLSGEHEYKPGDVQITIPAHMFKDRFGNDYGEMFFTYPEEPATNGVFSWKRVGDNYVFTNNETLLPATKGFIQIDVTGLLPHNLVDMELSEIFQAQIQVTTHAGNTLSLHSEKLQAEFDTEARIKKVTKSARDLKVVSLSDSEVPEGSRSASGKYVKVKWIMSVLSQGNTYYTLDYSDLIPEEYRGFIVGVTEDGVREITEDNVYEGYKSGSVTTYTIETAYPIEEVDEPGVDYTFHNHVDFTLTELDGEIEYADGMIDPQLVTSAGADAIANWRVPEPEPTLPIGHFMIFKNGNDDKVGNNKTHMGGSSSSDIHMWEKNRDHWYGVYPSALNDMRDIYAEQGENGYYNLSYTINSVGYSMPWMFDETSYATDGADAPKFAKNYTKPVTMTTRDWGLSLSRTGSKLKVLDEYKYVSVEFPVDPYVYSGVADKINEDGSFSAQTPKDGTFKYKKDTDKTHWPDIKLQILRDGNWEDWATASWNTGTFKVILHDGTEQSDRVVDVPADTESIRTIAVNENKATEGDTITNAALDYDIRVVFGLRTTENIMDRIENLFANSTKPKLNVYNRANLTAAVGDSELISIGTERFGGQNLDNRDAYDVLAGYDDKVMVIPSKTAKFNPTTDYDRATNKITVHYTAKVQKRSFITSMDTYEEAVEAGRIAEETHAVWRDLLPEGVVPKLETISVVRAGDSIKDIQMIPNYKGSGRTLLVVEVDLTPKPKAIIENDVEYIEDTPTITFDGIIDLNSVRQGYLEDPIHNIISYQSNNSDLGNVNGYMGETDNPISNNNAKTDGAFASEAEREAMTELDENCDTASFLFAGAVTQFDLPAAGITGLDKRVMVNNDGWWSKGLYYGDPENNRRDVYVGGQYAYRITYMPEEASSKVSDLVLFDSLENYYATADNDPIDIYPQAPRWKGTLRNVDTSYLRSLGCDPVVYYRVDQEELDLSAGFDGPAGKLGEMDIYSEDTKWIKADDYTGDLKAVRAYAIDTSRAQDGSKFIINPDQTIYAIVEMDAPEVDENGTVLDGVFNSNIDDNPHAYNNIYAIARTIDSNTGEEDYYHSIHTEYTKVGLKNREITITKEWDDDDDRDGLRPDTIDIELLADGKSLSPKRTVTLPIIGENGEKIWTYTFDNINTTDPEGNLIHYTFAEVKPDGEYGPPEGYTSSIGIVGEDRYKLINKHIPEKTSISGEKTWEGDEELNTRPQYIDVTLYEVLTDGTEKKVKTQRVYPVLGPDNEYYWTYSFDNLDKYRTEGDETIEIQYAVHEQRVGNVNLYEEVPNGYDITNKYHPYGPLKVKKEVTNATEKSKDQTFTFGFEFYKTKADNGDLEDPVFKDYAYDILDEDGHVIEELSGTVSTGGTVSIKGGQTIHVKDVEDKYWYKVYEIDDDNDGFTPTSPAPSSDGTIGYIGQISANTDVVKTFVNDYDAKGDTNLEGLKTLYGRELQRNKFHYYVYLVNEDGTETLISRNGSNEAADETTEEDGQIVSTGPINLATLNYTLNDVGKTYTYRIEEVVGTGTPDDLQNAVNEDGITYAEATPEQRAAGGFKLGGYIYDSRSYFATVEVSDNGDGTLKCDRTYMDKDGNPLPEGEKPLFENYYEAEGDYQFKARKILKGRELENEEFEFELSGPYVVKENGDVELLDSDVLPLHAKNNARGIAIFDTLHFDQDDIGKTYYYAIKEIIPSGDDKDPVVHYTDKVYGYKLNIADGSNNDGSLAINETPVIPVDAEGNQVVQDANGNFTIKGWVEENAEDAVFENTLEPGSLSVTKHVAETNAVADPDQLFHFKVVFTGPDLENGGPYIPEITNVDYEEMTGTAGSHGVVIPDALQAADGEVAESGDTAGEALQSKDTEDDLDEEAVAQEKSSNNEPPAQKVAEPGAAAPTKNSGNIFTKLLDAFTSLFADKAYAEDTGENGDIDGGVFRDVPWRITKDYELIIGEEGETYTFRFTEVVANCDADDWPWYTYANYIKKVRFAGTVKGNGYHNNMFAYMDRTGLKFDFDGFDTSEVTAMASMFKNCNSVKTLDLSGFDTSHVIHYEGMFVGCSALTEVDLSSFRCTKVVFGNAIPRLDNMFDGCRSLKSVNLAQFDTQKVFAMREMFRNCTSLEELDIRNFTTESLSNESMNRNMFAGTTNLKKVVLGPNFGIKWNLVGPFEEPKTSAPYTGKWIREDGMAGPYTATELVENYTADMAGTWVWQRGPAYKISFVPESDEALGSMPDGYSRPEEDYTIPDNKFRWFAHEFDYWEDNLGNTYEAQGTIPAGKYGPGDEITLTAHFKEVELVPVDGKLEIDLYLLDGEKATFNNIPAGTAYQVYEEDPENGWILVKSVDDSGEIAALETANAKFWNQYLPGSAFAQFNGSKMLDEAAAGADTFTFTLSEVGNEGGNIWIIDEYGRYTSLRLPYEVTTGPGGKVQFPTILYTSRDVGTHTYTITESVPDPQDPDIEYDSHTETVTVVVSQDEEGNLSAVKTTDDDGIVFKNKTNPGSLTITKHGVNVTDKNKDDVFTFEVELYDKNNRPLKTNDNITWHLTGSNDKEALTITNGKATLTCKAGETINVEGLPAGTTYSIREVGVPNGWTQTGYVGEEGTIVSNETAAAEFTNEYNAKGHGQIEAKKMLENSVLKAGQFGFYLYDEDHNLVEGPVYNNAPLGDGHSAAVLFSIIEYTIDDIGEHTYYVKEMVPDNDGQFIYDSHEEEVTVTVSDAGGGKLKVDVAYDNDGDTFINTEKPGNLRINKVLASGSPEGKEFSFRVRFFDTKNNETGDKEFNWMSYDSADALDPSKQGTVKSGDTLKVIGGGHILITELPAGYTYKIEELDTPGWSETHEGNEGTIISEDTVVATFTNEYNATGKVTFDAEKRLEGKPLTKGMFEFGVYDEDGSLVAKGVNDANGHVTFDDINYDYSDAGKTYNYTIKEITGNLPGINYADTVYNATVTITDNEDGTLKVDKDGDYEHMNFVNTYDATGSVTFKGTKTLNGREIKDDDVFTFEVKEGDKVVAAATGAKTGEHTAKIEYPTITYTLDDVGEHTYTVKETTEDGNGITVDTITYTVIVNVTDNGDGTLNVEKVDGSDDFNALNFVNNYAANGDITFNGTKQLNGRPLEEGEKFEFTLYDEDKNVIDTVESGENGAISFPTLHYTHKDDGKEFIYYAKETSKDGKGITVDTREYKITVTVTDLGNGQLDIEAVTDKEGIDVHHLIFVNEYEATGTLPFEGTKTLEGREMTEDDVFTFQVVDEKGNTWEVQNDADGNINYPEIEYVLNGEQDDTGTHTYTVTETTEDGNGIVVDTNEYVVVAEVKDNKDGTLNVDTKDGDDPMSLDFTNEYNAEGEIDFEATKELLGRDLKEEEFRFGLYEDDKLVSIAKNDEDGNIYFSKIEYDLEDAGKTYEYVMKEIDDELGGVFYDDSEYKVTVKVTDNGDGTLDVEAKGGKNVVFVNVYDAVGTLELAGTKTLEGREMTKNDIFEFTVSEDGEVIQTVENDKDGTIEFEPMEYTLDDVGRHTYTVKETIGNVKGMVYDETEYTVKVEVSDNEDGTLDVEILDRSDDPESLDFVNTDKPEEPPGPPTGDTTEFIPYIMVMAVSGLALLVLLLKRRKKEQE